MFVCFLGRMYVVFPQDMEMRKGHQLLMYSQLKPAVFSAIILFGCRKIDIPVQMKNPVSAEDDMISISSPLQARPFPPTWASCGLALCCRNAYACKLLGRDVLHGFPCPEWTKCCIFSTPAFGVVGSCRPAYPSQEYGNHMAKAKWMGTRGWGPRVCQQGLA